MKACIRRSGRRAGTFMAALGMIIALIMTAACLPEEVLADVMWPEGPAISSETAVVMDADTGVVLYDKDMNKVMYPASTTKILTCLLALENGTLTDSVTMTETGVSYAYAGSSNLNTQVGEVFTLEQMLYGTMLKSANDMATQVGEYIGGTLENFVDMMNRRAEALGCVSTHFTNACGMPDDNHYTTAYDLALISREALKNEEFRKITGTHAYEIPPTNLTAQSRSFTNHNPLLVNPEYAYPGIIGGKTGYTDAAGSTLVTFVSQNGRTQIVVTMKAADAGTAADDHRLLHDFGFTAFADLNLAGTYAQTGGHATVPAGVSDNQLTILQTVDEAGMTQVTYRLEDRVVGSAVMTAEQAAAYQDSLTGGASSDEALSSEEEPVPPVPVTPEKYERRGNRAFLIIFLILLFVLIILAAVMIALTVKAEKERRRRRKRRQQKRLRDQRRRMRQEAAERRRAEAEKP